MYTIYKITNTVNGMVYVGKTKNTVEHRWKKHCEDVTAKRGCTKLKKAILEHGSKNFRVEAIDTAETNDEANAKEVYWIKFYDSMRNGYNGSPGGRSGGHRKRVKCVEDGLVFDMIKDAAEFYGVAATTISLVVDRKYKAAGKHWISV